MPQNHADNEKTKERYEEQAQARKLDREDAAESREESALYFDENNQIHADHRSGLRGGAPSDESRLLITGDKIKHVYELLPSWHKDDLRRLMIVSPGTRLEVGGIYVDLHDLERGEFKAKGDELIHEELFVSKRDTDHETWDRLIRQEA